MKDINDQDHEQAQQDFNLIMLPQDIIILLYRNRCFTISRCT